jgi:EcsC protein family
MNKILLTPSELRILSRAVSILERESFIAKLTELTGEPVTRIMKMLPRIASNRIHRAVQSALSRALTLALTGLENPKAFQPEPWAFQAMSGITGGASGFFGLPALMIELPVTTVLILRSVATIARKRGEDLSDPAARLACLEVLALAPKNRKGLVAETSYYAARAFLAKTVSEAAANFLERGITNSSAPVIVDLVSSIGSRFGAVVTEKTAAGAIPVIGAVGGAAINLAFMEHFQKLAWAHFTVRRLERTHGASHVRKQYETFLRCK